MMRWLILWLMLAGPAAAQTATVRSGEHEGFSRLVVLLPQARDWALTRTAEGYAFGVAGEPLRYDLTQVFRMIPRTRLSAIWAEPADGRLNLALRCACHAEAFDLRPGVVVIDLRDGPPAAGSPWETTASGERAAPLAAAGPAPAQRPRARPDGRPDGRPGGTAPAYDWRAAAEAGRPRSLLLLPPEARAEPPAVPVDPGWKGRVLDELARAAARGDIDLGLPDHPLPAPPAPGVGGHLRVGGAPGPEAPPGAGLPLTAAGAACIPDAAVALGDWGDPRPVAQAIGPLTAALLGEFDRPDPAALDRAQRYYLHLGFGAEALALAALAERPLPDAAVRDSLARLVDGLPDPGGAFRGMAGCDTAAALWGFLAEPGTSPATETVLRTFSALPLHLRRHLAPDLAAHFLARGDGTAAHAVRDAVLRAPGDPGAAVRLMERRIDHPEGPPAAAVADLRAAPGPTGVLATIASLAAETRAGRPAAQALMTAAEAMLHEYRGAAEEPGLRAALAGAHVLRGEPDQAFALSEGLPDARAQVWALLAGHGSDGALMTHALAGAPPAGLAAATDRGIALRLVGMGLAEAALPWVAAARRGAVGQTAEDRRIEAQALMALGDARGALRLLAGDEDPAAADLRGLALRRLGDAAALDLLAVEEAQRMAREAGLWDRVAAGDTAPWAEAAARRTPVPPAEEGPLARAGSLVADSAAARQAIGALLTATAMPADPPVP